MKIREIKYNGIAYPGFSCGLTGQLYALPGLLNTYYECVLIIIIITRSQAVPKDHCGCRKV